MSEENKSNSKHGTWIGTILVGILGYFVYGNTLTGALGMVLLWIVMGLTSLLSIIPLVGFAIAGVVNKFYTMPAVLNLVGLEYTWLTTGMFWFQAIIGLIITIMITIVLILKIWE